jgi:hypothetical protein
MGGHIEVDYLSLLGQESTQVEFKHSEQWQCDCYEAMDVAPDMKELILLDENQ